MTDSLGHITDDVDQNQMYRACSACDLFVNAFE